MITIDHTTPISQAHERMRQRRKEVDGPPVHWRYFQQSDDYQEEGEPQQWFIVCSHDELRTIKRSNLISAGIQAAKLMKRRQRGPGIEGWYVQSKSPDGSKTWYLLGINTEQVVAFYDSL